MIYNHKLYQEDLVFLAEENLNWDRLRGKNILVTGATGLIGTFLIDAIMKRNELYQDAIMVYALSRNKEKLETKFGHYAEGQNLKIMVQDISKGFDPEGNGFDYVIHAASNTHPNEYSNDPVGTITTNVLGTYHLLEYVRQKENSRIVLLSSVEVYGENKGDVTSFGEDYCGYINCNTLRAGYPESKRLSEAMLQAYIGQHHVDGIAVRLSRTYGPTIEPDDSKAISQFIRKAVYGEDIVLKSDGKQMYSYCYVADIAGAILKCMTAGNCGEAYNAADNASDISLKEIAEYLAGITGRQVVYELPDENEKRGYSTATKALMDSEKIKKLGWDARYSIKEGLVRTVSILKDARRVEVCAMDER